jgi:hypothetical protein
MNLGVCVFEAGILLIHIILVQVCLFGLIGGTGNQANRFLVILLQYRVP